MNDVEIIFPRGREAIVERLREAIGRAGYEVEAGEGVEDDAWPSAGRASAVLILWDRATMAHPGLHEVAAEARQAGRALDISTDGITPRGFRDESRLIQLSGWRGEPFHPGWKRILAEVQRLCGGERKAAPSPPTAHGERQDDPAREPSSRPGGRRGKLLPLALVVAFVLVAALIVALLTSKRPLLPQPARPPVAPAVTAAHPVRALSPVDRRVASVSEAAPSAESGAGGAPVPNVAAKPVPVRLVPELTAPSASAAPKHAKLAKARPKEKPRVVHYTKYAKTMRLFCERSGRDTPECRLFLRQTRGAKP